MRLAQLRSIALLLSVGLMVSACGTSSTTSQTLANPLRLVKVPGSSPAYLGEPYFFELVADGGVRAYRYTIDGTLPDGIKFESGRFSGTPTKLGTYEFYVLVQDANINSRTQKVTLTVGAVRPPSQNEQFPLSEEENPFKYRLSLADREVTGFRAQLSLANVTLDEKTFAVPKDFLYLYRLNPENGLFDIDAVAIKPLRDLTIMDMTLTPKGKVRLEPRKKIRFLDKEYAPFVGGETLARVPNGGRYTYQDLIKIAKNWGKTYNINPPKPVTQEESPALETKPNPETEISGAVAEDTLEAQSDTTEPAADVEPTSEAGVETAIAKETAVAEEPQISEEPTPENEVSGETTPAAEVSQSDATDDATLEQPATDPLAEDLESPDPSSESSPVEADLASPSEVEPETTSPSEAPVTELASPVVAPTSQTPVEAPKILGPSKGDGDLNGDGLVDQTDFDLLKSNYRWDDTNPPATESANPAP